MKHITIEINKTRTSEEMQNTIVEDINIDLNGITVILNRVSKPDECISIYKRFIHAVEVVF